MAGLGQGVVPNMKVPPNHPYFPWIFHDVPRYTIHVGVPLLYGNPHISRFGLKLRTNLRPLFVSESFQHFRVSTSKRRRIPCIPGTLRASSIIGLVLRNLETHPFCHGGLERRSPNGGKNCSSPRRFLSQNHPRIFLILLCSFSIVGTDRRAGILLTGLDKPACLNTA